MLTLELGDVNIILQNLVFIIKISWVGIFSINCVWLCIHKYIYKYNTHAFNKILSVYLMCAKEPYLRVGGYPKIQGNRDIKTNWTSDVFRIINKKYLNYFNFFEQKGHKERVFKFLKQPK